MEARLQQRVIVVLLAAAIYRVERELAQRAPDERLVLRSSPTRPLREELHTWLAFERRRVPDGSATAKGIDYSLRHWTALTRNLPDGNVPVDNNHLENLVRPWAMGRKAWLFADTELAGKRAAVVMSLVQSASAADPVSAPADRQPVPA